MANGLQGYFVTKVRRHREINKTQLPQEANQEQTSTA